MIPPGGEQWAVSCIFLEMVYDYASRYIQFCTNPFFTSLSYTLESHASTFKNGVIFSSSILILCPDTRMFI